MVAENTKQSKDLNCPYCNFKICNTEKIKINKKYSCGNCKNNFFVICVPKVFIPSVSSC